MQEGKENMSSLISSSSANKLVKNPITEEMCTQSNLFQLRGAMCISFIDEAMVKNREMEIRNQEMEIYLKKAIEEAKFWKKCSHEKTALCHELASRLFILKKEELKKKRAAERDFEEEAESSSGDNGDDDVDTASTMMCKRRRI